MSNGNMPAMPVTEERIGLTGDRIITARGGLTKREYFAAMAMQGLCTRKGYGSPAMVALDAVEFADALLAELDKEST